MTATDREVLVELSGVYKHFGDDPATRTEVLHDIDLQLRAGELVALVGPSGSGKSTLLNLLGLLDRASSGTLRVRGHDVSTLGDAALTELRGATLGFIFQFHHLLPGLSVVENVMLPAASRDGRLHAGQRPRAAHLLEKVGLAGQEDRLARQLSGGMQQRVAIARALMNAPALVYADEPTGNLDTVTSARVLDFLKAWNAEQGTAFLIVTHDPGVARQCQRVLRLVDGRLVGDGPPSDVLVADI